MWVLGCLTGFRKAGSSGGSLRGDLNRHLRDHVCPLDLTSSPGVSQSSANQLAGWVSCTVMCDSHFKGPCPWYKAILKSFSKFWTRGPVPSFHVEPWNHVASPVNDKWDLRGTQCYQHSWEKGRLIPSWGWAGEKKEQVMDEDTFWVWPWRMDRFPTGRNESMVVWLEEVYWPSREVETEGLCLGNGRTPCKPKFLSLRGSAMLSWPFRGQSFPQGLPSSFLQMPFC